MAKFFYFFLNLLNQNSLSVIDFDGWMDQQVR